LLERDGYHMLVDWLGIPKLRHHARDWLKAGAHRDQGATAVAAYALATVVWSLLTVGFVIFLTLRYKDQLLAVAPDGLVWVLIACFWALLLVPAAIGIARPIGSRLRAGEKVAT
jgi:dolichyl-phosphate-mannose--protein O-mannosyl transferase